MSRVFVTQIPHKRDNQTAAFVPSVNISPATEFGELVIMMPPRATFFATNDLLKQLDKLLADYNCEDGDCLLPLGDPVIVAASCALLSKKGSFTVLRWDKNLGRYCSSKISI